MILAVFFVLLVFGDLVEANVIELRLDGRIMERTGANMRALLKEPGIFRAQASPSATRFQAQPPYMEISLDSILDMLQELLIPNLLLPQKVFYTAGYDSLYLKEAFEINARGRDIQNPAEYRYLNLLNIKYTVSMKANLDPSYRLISHGAPAYLYLNDNVLPRAFWVPEARKAESHEKILDIMLTKEFDPTAWIYLEEDPPARTGEVPSRRDPSSVVEITRYTPDRVWMDVSTPSHQWLFFSDIYYPGWKAFVDGKPARIYRANYAFRALWIQAGDHTVEWKYDPILFKIGLGISALTALALAAYFFKKTGATKEVIG